MFLPGFKDLAKPQWLATLAELKCSGELPVSELSRRLEISYMAAKQHCEALKKLGYLERTRAPRREVGRPEIFYRLTPKADGLFPEAGVAFSLELLDHLQALFGENAPERLLFQHFQRQQQRWSPRLAKARSLIEKATLLTDLREQAGCLARCKYDPEKGLRIEEFHHPLRPIFAKFPHAIGMELRMLEALLGTRVTRREIAGGRHGPARVDYEVATLGVL
jgi:predicted ArsR family transcriptional regulator